MTEIIEKLSKEKINVSELYQEECYLYILFLDNKIVYVGQSVNVLGRVKTHFRKGLYSKNFDFYSFIAFSEIKHLYNSIDDAEADFICKYRPFYNKTIPKNNLWVSLKKISKLIYSVGGNHMNVRKLIGLNDNLETTIFEVQGGWNKTYYND